MYERFTPDARRALEAARDAARLAESAFIEPIHVLLGVAEAGGRAAVAMSKVGLDPQAAPVPAGEPSRPAGSAIPFSDSGKAVLNEVVRAATTADGLADISDSHVLLGVLNIDSPDIAEVADAPTVEALRQELVP